MLLNLSFASVSALDFGKPDSNPSFPIYKLGTTEPISELNLL